ncbi:MAG: phosphoglycerate kinase, partial [Rhodobacterales bacterium]
KKVDYLVIGGGMANTFLFAQGIQIGNSLCEKDLKEISLEVMDTAKKNNCEIILPKDVVVASEFKANAEYNIKDLNNIKNYEMILDIGPSTCKKINEIFSISKTLIWNGPMGAFELEPFDNGTIDTSLCAGKLTETGELISVAGGGDTVSALKKSKADKKFSYVSLAGGAFLEWMEGKSLPGIKCLL